MTQPAGFLKRRAPSADEVDRARPDEMPVLLRHADIEGVVGDVRETDATLEAERNGRIAVGQAKDAQAPLDAAGGIEHQIVAADIGDRDLGLDQAGLDAQPPGARLRQHGIEAAEAAGGERLPGDFAGTAQRHRLVEIPQVYRADPLDAVAGYHGAAVPDRLAAAAAILRALPDDSDAGAELLRRIGPDGLEHSEAGAQLDPPERRRADHFDGAGHLRLAGGE